jgi:hypothetical protein
MKSASTAKPGTRCTLKPLCILSASPHASSHEPYCGWAPLLLRSFLFGSFPTVEYSFFTNAFERPKGLQFGRTEFWDWLFLHVSQKNRVLNRYATYTKENTQALRLPWAQVDKEFARLREKYVSNIDTWDFVVDPFGSILLSNHIEGQLKTRELLRQLRILDGHFRLETLLVQLVTAEIPDKNIETFLASADRGLWNEFSDAPMKWDAKNRRIYFADPSDMCTINYVRVPQPVGSKQPPPPRSSTWIC